MKKRVLLAALALFIAILSYSPVLAADGYKEYGIDVSAWNGILDFRQIKESGKDFVILRAGFSGTKDTYFEQNYIAAKAAGLNVGVYIYSYAQNVAEAEEDARDVLSWIKGKQLEYPVFFDIENEKWQGGLSTALRTQMCIAFIKKMRENGFLAGVYANENWFNNYLDKSLLTGSELWLAKWTPSGTDSITVPGEYHMWQYSDKGTLPGHNCYFDLDVSYFNYAKYMKENGLNGFPLYDPDLPFTDVKMTAWYYDSVKYCYDNELFMGTSPTTFSPETQMTRAMFVTVLGRLCRADVTEYTSSPFLDVNMNTYYGPYIEWAREKEIVSGMTANMFEPDSPITREQMCRMLCGFADAMGITLNSGASNKFTDDDKIASWAHESVLRLAAAGIVTGMGNGSFSPKTNTTRAQCSSILKRIS